MEREGGFWAFKTSLCKEKRWKRGRRMRRQFGLTSWTASSFHSIPSVAPSLFFFSPLFQSITWRSSTDDVLIAPRFSHWLISSVDKKKSEQDESVSQGSVATLGTFILPWILKKVNCGREKNFKKTWSDPRPWSSLSCHFSPPQTTISLDFFHSLIIIKSHLTSPLFPVILEYLCLLSHLTLYLLVHFISLCSTTTTFYALLFNSLAKLLRRVKTEWKVIIKWRRILSYEFSGWKSGKGDKGEESVKSQETFFETEFTFTRIICLFKLGSLSPSVFFNLSCENSFPFLLSDFKRVRTLLLPSSNRFPRIWSIQFNHSVSTFGSINRSVPKC